MESDKDREDEKETIIKTERREKETIVKIEVERERDKD